MRKTHICLTIDTDVLFEAKQKIPNLSAYFNECIIAYTKMERPKDDLKEQLEGINNSMQELAIKKSIVEMEMKRSEEEALIKAKELKAQEKFKRWICSVCLKYKKLKVLNFMDQDRCSNCSTKARDLTGTTFEFVTE